MVLRIREKTHWFGDIMAKEDLYNEKVYKATFNEVKDLKYYHSIDELKSVMKTLMMNNYFPNDNLDEEEVEHDINWALADALGNGCELEVVER